MTPIGVGHPQAETRQHKTLHGDSQFAPGAQVAQGGTIREIIPVHASRGVRFRLMVDRAGTLDAFFLRPGVVDGQFSRFTRLLDGNDLVCATGNPAQVAVAVDTEALLQLGADEILGEAYLLVSYTEGGVGVATVAYANYCQI